MTNETHYIGLDVHKKSIQFCAKTADGTIVDEGRIAGLLWISDWERCCNPRWSPAQLVRGAGNWARTVCTNGRTSAGPKPWIRR